MLPLYANVPSMPAYLSKVTLEPSTDCFYWSSRLIGALADPYFAECSQEIERYENAVMTKGRGIVLEYDRKMKESGDFSLTREANARICDMVREQTADTLTKVLGIASAHMKNGYNRADN